MKTADRGASTRLLLCLAASGFAAVGLGEAAGSITTQEAVEREVDTYVVDDEPVTLVLSRDYVALRLDAGASESMEAVYRIMDELTRVGAFLVRERILDRHGLALAGRRPETSVADFRARLRDIGGVGAEIAPNPVYQGDGYLEVLLNEFYVRSQDDQVLPASSETIWREYGATVIDRDDDRGRYTITFEGVDGRQALELADRLRIRSDMIRDISPRLVYIATTGHEVGIDRFDLVDNDCEVLAPSSGNDPLVPHQWGLAMVQAVKAWKRTRGAGTVIAVVDNGVDLDHPEFDASRVVFPYDALDGDEDPSPSLGEWHGTAVAGIALAEHGNQAGGVGLAAAARLMPIRAVTRYPANRFDSEDVREAMAHAARKKADVVVFAWTVNATRRDTARIDDAIDALLEADVVVVLPAGNGNDDTVLYPAKVASAKKGVIAVSGTNGLDELQSPPTGSGRWGSNYGDEITLAAPGDRILTADLHGPAGCDGDFRWFDGTSAAAAFVAGGAALVLSECPSFSAEEVRKQLELTSDDLGESGWDRKYGSGRLNARRALTEAWLAEGRCSPGDSSVPGTIR